MAKLLQLRRGTTAENDLFTGDLAEPTYDTDRKEIRVHDGSTQGGKIVSVATGIMAPFAGTTAPSGWLVCDGSAISRTDYADLFAQIGSTYGDGDGSLTFNLPDCDGHLPVYDSGKTIGDSTNGGVPNISGGLTNVSSSRLGGISATGAFTATYRGQTSASGNDVKENVYNIGFSANNSSSVYDNGTTVRPAGVCVLWCIKY